MQGLSKSFLNFHFFLACKRFVCIKNQLVSLLSVMEDFFKKKRSRKERRVGRLCEKMLRRFRRPRVLSLYFEGIRRQKWEGVLCCRRSPMFACYILHIWKMFTLATEIGCFPRFGKKNNASDDKLVIKNQNHFR